MYGERDVGTGFSGVGAEESSHATIFVETQRMAEVNVTVFVKYHSQRGSPRHTDNFLWKAIRTHKETREEKRRKRSEWEKLP